MDETLEEDPFAPEATADAEGGFDDAFNDEVQDNLDDVRSLFQRMQSLDSR